jgi:hypothetical protein
MSWKDLADGVMKAATNTFGEDVIYTPSGGSSFPLRAVFRDQYFGIDSATGLTVASDQPHIGVRDADFEVKPKQGDKVTIGDEDFIVTSVQRDGDAGSILFLHEKEEEDEEE